MEHVTKICADSLRAYISNNFSIKLKSTHAHELVAAFFGYKSKAALRTDTIAPISNLPQAEIIVLAPSEPIDERRKDLKDLPCELPAYEVLGEIIYSTLLSHKLILIAPWPTDKHVAIYLADEYLRAHKIDKIYRAPLSEGVSIEDADNHKQLYVKRLYQLPLSNATTFRVHQVKITTSITLPFMAGRIGYGKPEISVEIENLGMR